MESTIATGTTPRSELRCPAATLGLILLILPL
jgi:hypothetical protein